MRPTIAPVKNAMYRESTIFGKPNKRPIKKDNLTSPNPIPFPLVAKNKKRKNKKAPALDRK